MGALLTCTVTVTQQGNCERWRETVQNHMLVSVATQSTYYSSIFVGSIVQINIIIFVVVVNKIAQLTVCWCSQDWACNFPANKLDKLFLLKMTVFIWPLWIKFTCNICNGKKWTVKLLSINCNTLIIFCHTIILQLHLFFSLIFCLFLTFLCIHKWDILINIISIFTTIWCQIDNSQMLKNVQHSPQSSNSPNNPSMEKFSHLPIFGIFSSNMSYMDNPYVMSRPKWNKFFIPNI